MHDVYTKNWKTLINTLSDIRGNIQTSAKARTTYVMTKHLKTVKRFHNRISINYRQVKDSSMGWDFFKCPWKMWILSQKFRWKKFFHWNFFWSPLQYKHVLDHPENVESFHSCISSGKRHLRVSTCDSSFSKTSSNCEI